MFPVGWLLVFPSNSDQFDSAETCGFVNAKFEMCISYLACETSG